MTFSIAARSIADGTVGVAISSSSICVASRCAFVRAGVGAVLTQNVTDPTLGPAVLDAMAAGNSADAALAQAVDGNATIEWRQVLIQPLSGAPRMRSGTRTLGRHAEAVGRDCIAAGNLLADGKVPRSMVDAFESSRGHLANRLVAALEAGLAAGGEAGPVHSAGVLVAGAPSWPIVDLRVDYAEVAPIAALRELWRRYEPQMPDYVLRARDPGAAPSYGVPGNL